MSSSKDNVTIVERKKKKATKVHVYVQCFSFFFQACEDLLKFDTTAYSYHSGNRLPIQHSYTELQVTLILK